jgi:hypothetical protein
MVEYTQGSPRHDHHAGRGAGADVRPGPDITRGQCAGGWHAA